MGRHGERDSTPGNTPLILLNSGHPISASLEGTLEIQRLWTPFLLSKHLKHLYGLSISAPAHQEQMPVHWRCFSCRAALAILIAHRVHKTQRTESFSYPATSSLSSIYEVCEQPRQRNRHPGAVYNSWCSLWAFSTSKWHALMQYGESSSITRQRSQVQMT